jgi:hypothetical protein
MAIAEPHARPQGDGEPPASDPPRSRRRHPRRRWILLTASALVAAAVVVLGTLAGTYQPIRGGGESGTHFPGLPTGTGLRSVNTFGIDPGQIYAPPQRGAFTILQALSNVGPEPVTIEAISILSPQQQAEEKEGEPGYPLTLAGAVRWIPACCGNWPASGRPVAGLSLAPGQDILIGIPLRQVGTCYDPNGWTSPDGFYVKERYLTFTHWVTVPFQPGLVLHYPNIPGQKLPPGYVCLSK